MEAKKGAGKKGSGKANWALNHIQNSTASKHS